MKHSRRSKRGRRRCCPNIDKWLALLRWTNCIATATKQLCSDILKYVECAEECYEFPITSKTNVKRKDVTSAKTWRTSIRKEVQNHIADTIKFKTPTRDIFTEHKKLFSFSPSHAPRKSEEQKFFLTKTRSKSSTLITNNSNVIPTIDRQGVSNRNIVGINAP